jgi:hypothetical protein
VEAKDIILIVVLGGLILLSRRREEAVPPPPPEEKPPLPPPWPYPPILELPPEIEEAMKPITPEVERLTAEARARLEEARRIIEEVQRRVEERRLEAEEQLPPIPPPPPPPQYIPPPAYPAEPTPPALEEFERAMREYSKQEWERVEQALITYGGYAVIFKVEPPSERITMFMNMLVNINVNTRGMCVHGGGYRWYDYLQAWVYDVKASWSPSMVGECKRHIRSAIESAFGGYYAEVREY